VSLNAHAETLIAHPVFDKRDGETVRVVERTVAELGLADGATLPEVFAAAAGQGLGLCPPETGPYLRLAWPGQANSSDSVLSAGRSPEGAVKVASVLLSDDVEVPKGFSPRVVDGRQWLRGYRCDDLYGFSADDRFAFRQITSPRPVSEWVLMADARVTGVGVVESAEPLVDLESAGVMRVSDRKRARNPHVSLAREGVARRLAKAARLLPSGVGLLGIEAFRPPQLQQLFDDTYAERVRRENPDLGAAALARPVSRFVAPPETASHPTGAAIDLTLCDEVGVELDLGSNVDATPEDSAGACDTAATGLSREPAAHRQLLVSVLTEVGLVNDPTEWWHWSYGDRYWAMATGNTHAIDAPTAAPTPGS